MTTVTSVRLFLSLCACVLVLAACTSDPSSPAPSSPAGSSPAASSPVGSTAASSSAASSAPVVAPVDEGKVRASEASSCPLMTETFVQNTVGMRLARITVLRNDVRLVGCRFYALQNSPLARTEHLPGPNQPAVEIVAQRYPSSVAAHNAFVRAADQGSNPQQLKLSDTVTTVCFQAEFDPHDKDQDWACGFSTGKTSVLVRVAQTTPALNTFLVTKKALSAL